MTRYQTLRRLGCGRLTASLVALMNHLIHEPAGQVRFMGATVYCKIKEKP
jgi:hypothetical protein